VDRRPRPPRRVPPLRAPALLALSLAFLALVGFGPTLAAPESGAEEHASGGDLAAARTPARAETPAGSATGPVVVGGRPLRSCTATGRNWRFNGSRQRREVALTFDDGPSPFTPRILDVLERERVRATFFLVGVHVPGGTAVMRRVLQEGSMIGNHSYSHADLSKDAGLASHELTKTNMLIRSATGFTPCLFRAPYGAVSPRLLQQARHRGMLTIQWNVDPEDYRGTDGRGVADRVVQAAKPGAIIVMHDGGGQRSVTVSALHSIIKRLRHRGYKLVTVDQLLGVQRSSRPPAA